MLITSVATVAAAGALLGVGMPAASAATCPSGRDAVATRSYLVTHRDGSTSSYSYLDNTSPSSSTTPVAPGDIIKVTFSVAEGCTGTEVGLASYRTQSATFDPNQPQSLYDSQSGAFDAGSHTLTVRVPLTAADGSTCPNPHDNGPSTKDKGANTSGAYDSTCDGSPSANGNGGGNANGKPCAGCVGNADNKNPPGQAPDGSDHNAGYECDRNNGVGKSNPAHSSCKPVFFQVDFFVGPVLQTVDGSHLYGPRLIDAYNGPKG
jgi:hypothetical protein